MIVSFIQHSNKLHVESTRKNQHEKIWHAKTDTKKFDTQTCENDTFVCEIHTHACRFLNIFLLRQAKFFRTRVWFQHAECDSYMQRAIFTRSSVFSTRSSVISTRMIVILTHSRVISTRISVILTRSSVISTRMSVIYTKNAVFCTFYHRDLDGISCSSGLLLFASILWDLLSSIVIFQTRSKTSQIWEQILFSGFFFKTKWPTLKSLENGSRFYQFLKYFLFPLLEPESNFYPSYLQFQKKSKINPSYWLVAIPHAWVWFWAARGDFHTHACDFDTLRVEQLFL
jgi:hypothetical protein